MAYEFARNRYDGGWLGWYTFPDESSETKTLINGSTSNPKRMLLRIKGTKTSDNRATAELTLNFTYMTNYSSPTLTYYVYTSLPNLSGYAVPGGYVSYNTINLTNTSNGYAKGSLTATFSIGQSVDNIYIFFLANSGTVLTDYNGKSTSTYAWSASLTTKSYAYTACTAPTSITVTVGDGTRNLIKPIDTLNISWSGAQAGSNNAISYYKVAIRFGAEPSLTTNHYLSDNIYSPSNSLTVNLNLTNSTYTRGNYLRVKVYVYGVNYNPSTVPSKLIVFNNNIDGIRYLNRLPTAPSITGNAVIPSTSSIITTLIPSSTDPDGQAIKYYYSIGSASSTRKKYNQTTGINISATTDVYFWAFDGLEYSDSTKITVTKNILPTADISYDSTPFLVQENSYVDYVSLRLQANKSCSLNIQIEFQDEHANLSYNYINKTINQQEVREIINLQEILYNYTAIYNKLQTGSLSWRIKTIVKDNLEEKSEYYYPSSTWFSTPQFPTDPLLFNELNQQISDSGAPCVGNNIKIQFTKNSQFLKENQNIDISLYNNSNALEASAVLNGTMTSDNNNMYITANIPMEKQGPSGLHGSYIIKFQLKGSNFQNLTVGFNKNIFIVEQPQIGVFSYAPGANGTNTVDIKPFTDQNVYFTVERRDSLSTETSGDVWQNGIIQYSINRKNWFDQITNIEFNTEDPNLYKAYIDIKEAYSFNRSLNIPIYSRTYQRYARLKLVNIFGQEFYSNSVPFILNFEEPVEQISCESLKLIKDTSKAFNISTNKLQQGTNFEFNIKYKGYTEREMDFYLYAKVGTEVVAQEQKITPARRLFLVETDTPDGARTRREETISLTYTNLPPIISNNNWTWYIKAVPKGQQVTDEAIIKIDSSTDLITKVAPQVNPNSKIISCTISNNQVKLTGENLISNNAIKYCLLEEGNIVVDNAESSKVNEIIFNQPSDWTTDLSGKKIQLLIIDQPKSSGNNGILFDGIEQRYYSNEFIIYSDQPTIAYRPNHLGINTSSPDDTDYIIDIRPTSKYKKVRLYDSSTNGNVIELDLSKVYDNNNNSSCPAIVVKKGTTEYTLFFD